MKVLFMKTHIWFPISKKINYMFCGRCGLINLNNPITKRLINQACSGKEDD
jgi:hypothetical protein